MEIVADVHLTGLDSRLQDVRHELGGRLLRDMNSAAVCCAKPEVKGSMTVISIPSLAMSSSFFRRVTRRGGHRSGAMTF
jgi:hypothetical protein